MPADQGGVDHDTAPAAGAAADLPPAGPVDVDPNDVDPNDVDPNDADSNDLEPDDLDSNDVDSKHVASNDLDSNDVDPNDVDPRHLGHELGSRFVRAVAYAADVHAGQLRKGGDVPYLAHLLGVAALVLEFGGDELQATVAVLHDTAEDQGGQVRLDEVRERFGDDVAVLVEELSDALPAPGEEPGPWRPRKEAYLEDLRTAVATDSPSVLVAACDKLDNVESVVAHATDPQAPHHDGARTDAVGLDVFEEYDDGPAGASWYYRSLVDVFEGSDLPVRLLGRLRAAVGQLDALADQARLAGGA